MSNNINEDHKEFRDVVSGKINEELKKYITSGHIMPRRSKNGKMGVTIPHINLPHITYGKPQEGVGRGKGKPGDVIGKDKGKDKGGFNAGDDAAEGIEVQVEMEDVVRMLKNELELPDLKPKPNQTFEDEKTVYNGISKVGPNALLHKRRTLRETMKRCASQGLLGTTHQVFGYNQPVPLLLPNNDDRRYRQYNIVRRPTSNAVIFYMRDGSGSMDAAKCDVVSDISWWLDLWIRSFYKKTESVYIWHDTEAREVSQDVFYNLRYGGGTRCSSALREMRKMVSPKGRYDPSKWNIYAFYFGDGENETNDNSTYARILEKDLGIKTVNLFGLCQVMAYSPEGTLKRFVDKKGESGRFKNLRTTEVQRPDGAPWNYFDDPEVRNPAVKKALQDLIGKGVKSGQTGVKLEEIA